MEIPALKVSELKPALNPTLVTNLAGLDKLHSYLESVDIFGYDSETNVVKDFTQRRVRTLQFGDRDQQYVVDLLALSDSPEALQQDQCRSYAPQWLQELRDCVQPALASKSKLKIGVRLQFDYEVSKYCLGIRSTNFYDCLLAEKAIYCGMTHFMAKNFWSMEDMFARYAKMTLNKEAQTTFDLENPLTEEQFIYAALDTRIPFSIMKGQAGIIEKANLSTTVQVDCGAIPGFGDMHLAGFKLDEDRWLKIVDEAEDSHKASIKRLDTFFIPVCGTKEERITEQHILEAEEVWRNTEERYERAEARGVYQALNRERKAWAKKIEECQGDAIINYGSHPQLLESLRLLGFTVAEVPSTDERFLSKLTNHPVIAAIQGYRTTEKSLSTYGRGFLEQYINPTTKRIHSDIDLLGAATGRSSSAKPNIQNIPNGADYRSCFVARPGYVIITVDYSGCELRILAQLSGEKIWIDAFNKGWDVHSVGAEIIFGKEWEDARQPGCKYYENDHQKCNKKICPKHAELRDQIKAINFGIAYGMEAQKLADGLGITKAQAEDLLKKWRAAFKAVTAYLKQSGEIAKATLASRTICGRRRLYAKPSWEVAKERALGRAKKDGKPISQRDISRAYYAMFGNIEREGKNSPIQGTNADMAKVAVALMTPDLEEKYGAVLVNFVHDEFVVEAPADRAQEVYEFVGSCMTEAGRQFIDVVTMTYEGVISDCWKKG